MYRVDYQSGPIKISRLFLVDDGSKDNMATIGYICIGRDNRIKVIHKENGGLSDARKSRF